MRAGVDFVQSKSYYAEEFLTAIKFTEYLQVVHLHSLQPYFLFISSVLGHKKVRILNLLLH